MLSRLRNEARPKRRSRLRAREERAGRGNLITKTQTQNTKEIKNKTQNVQEVARQSDAGQDAHDSDLRTDRKTETDAHMVMRQKWTGGNGRRRHSGTGADDKTITRETEGKHQGT